MPNLLDRWQYRVSQGARVAFYGAHYRLGAELQRKDKGPRPVTEGPVPPVKAVRAAMTALFEDDWRNIEAGIYAMPHDLVPRTGALLKKSRAFFADIPKVAARRARGDGVEVRETERPERYPPYYLQNFHYQTDGYLSETSAALYDFQVEALFAGAADAMRRQALVPLAAFLKGRDQRAMRLLDIACGTGRFLSFVKDNYPRLDVTGLDLSPAYLDEARRNLAQWRGVDILRANAESLPFDDGSQDIVTSIFLFHELPPKVRVQVAGEIGRVLKPGGLCVIVDSLQIGDRPEFDGLLELFPARFHEPFYLGYAREDLAALFGAAGLTLRESKLAYLSKVMTFEKAV